MNSDSDRKNDSVMNMHEAALLVADHVDAMLAYWDRDQICRFANQAYRGWFGKTREEIIGTHISKLLGPLYVMNLPFIEAALSGEKQVFEREIPLPSGGTRHSLATYTPHVVGGEVLGFFAHVADSTLLKKLEAELKFQKEKAEELATHDFLTGLPNRVLLLDRINYAIANAKRKNGITSVMSLDMDKFKNANDTFGHDVGDLLLKEIASRVLHLLRETDALTRMGGDEFMLVSTEVHSVEDAERIATRILNSMNEPFECLPNDTIKPTFSIGIAIYPINGETLEALMKSSDLALYKAKNAGRNRFEFA